MGLSGSFNINRRPNRSYESHHRDKRRSGVDRLAMLESRNGPVRRRPSPFRELVKAIGSILRKRS